MKVALYKFIFKISQYFLENKNTVVWYRNSLYFANILFLKSDIDLTVFFKSSHNSRDVAIFFKKFKFLKFFFPILGEVNCITHNVLKTLTWHNCYELKRDPILVNLMLEHNLKTIFDNNNSKKVFIGRMIIVSFANLKNGYFDKRKWDFYFSLVGHNAPKNIEEVLRFCTESQEISLDIFWHSLIFNPIPKIANSISGGLFELLIQKCQMLNSDDKDILLQNLYWEIAATSCQLHLESDVQKNHITNIQEIIKYLV